MSISIYFGSGNKNKIEEIRTILPSHFRLLTYADVPNPPDPEETGSDLEANAILKAQAYFHATGKLSFADDTGLEVESLNGAPGVFSARYAGKNATYEENYLKLLTELQPFNRPEERKARFRTVIALSGVQNSEEPVLFEGKLEGIILSQPSGNNGFGYDPVFYVPEKNLTLAQMTSEEKNAISHRKRALNGLINFLSQLKNHS